jgi:hypothetical protein
MPSTGQRSVLRPGHSLYFQSVVLGIVALQYYFLQVRLEHRFIQTPHEPLSYGVRYGL